MDGGSRQMVGKYVFDTVRLTNGATITVTPYNGMGIHHTYCPNDLPLQVVLRHLES
jgi:hypothetical protein